MIAGVQVVGLSEFKERLRRLKSGLDTDLWAGLNTVGIKVQKHIQTQKLSGQVLKVRSGRLRRSITYAVTRETGGISVAIGTVVEYAGVHEFGGIIRPVNTKYLAIPLAAARTPAGVTRGSPRSFADTFVKNGIIFQTKGDSIIPLFVLKKQVTIPARPFLRPSLRETKAQAVEILSRAISKAMRGP